MHASQMEQLTSQRGRELVMQAQRAGPRVMRPGPRSSVRHRAGWTLIEIGLRLAGTSPDA
jgi:hypothetical protein